MCLPLLLRLPLLLLQLLLQLLLTPLLHPCGHRLPRASRRRCSHRPVGSPARRRHSGGTSSGQRVDVSGLHLRSQLWVDANGLP